MFSRTTSEDNTVIVELGDGLRAKDTPRKLKALAEVGARPNQLFLTEVINLNDPQVQGPYFEKVIRWFRSTLSIIRPDARFAALFDWLAKDKEFAGFAGRVLHEASTGIAGVKVEDEEVPLSKVYLPDEDWSHFAEDLATGHTSMLRSADGEEILVDSVSQENVKVRKLFAVHDSANGKQVRFPFQRESDGSTALAEPPARAAPPDNQGRGLRRR